MTTATPSPPSCNNVDKHGWHQIPVSIHVDQTCHATVVVQQQQQEPTKLPSAELCQEYAANGFVILEKVLHLDLVHALNEELEQVLRGRFNRNNCPPDKQPKKLPKNNTKPLCFDGNLNNVKVLQVINIHKSNLLFRSLATSPILGEVVSKLANWESGARLVQDQVWAKPPGGAPLVFHRDSPYFMFDPPDVVTVWIALDDLDSELGPLEYVVGSHKWGNGRIGTSRQFFQSKRHVALLESAAQRENQKLDQLQFCTTSGLKAGGISIHNGRTWHGSDKNTSRTKPRRGLGLHFIPKQAKFTNEAAKSQLWKRYVTEENGILTENLEQTPLSQEDFPITWEPS